MVVLTVAHVYDKRPEACSLLNLAALCQRCHNRHDAKERMQGRFGRQQAKLAIADLFDFGLTEAIYTGRVVVGNLPLRAD